MGQTLGEILALLPDVGRERLAYNPSFWVIKANEILSEIESSSTGASLTCESVVPARAGRTMYRIPGELRKVKRVRRPTDGSLDMRDGTNLVDFTHVNNFIRILDPAEAEGRFVSGTVTGGTREEITVDVGAEDLAGGPWVAIITHNADAGGYGQNYGNYYGGGPSELDGWVEYRRVLEFTEDAGVWTLVLDGDLDLDPSGNIVLTNDFFIFSGLRRLRRFVDMNTVSPLPTEWNHIIHKGLRWYMEIQNDEGNGESARAFELVFREALEKYISEQSDAFGDEGRFEPRQSLAWGMFR